MRRTPRDLHYGERELVVKDFPLGIEPEKFNDSLASEEVKQQISILREAFRGTKLIVGVDRLDYTKGLPQKLYAFDRFLKDNPEWSGKVVLVQLCIPSRSTVPEYVDLRREVEEMVGRINGNHG